MINGSSKKVGHDFDKIRQLLLIEEFKWGLSNEIKTYLSEQKVDTLDSAAWLADDYSLTHKVIFVSKPFSQHYSSDKKLFHLYGDTIKSQSGTPSTSRASNQAPNNSADQKTLYDFFCNYCKKNGHFRSDCRALQKSHLKESIKPTGLTSNRSSSHKSSVKNNVVVEVTKSQPDSVMEIYESYISEGMISFMDDSTKPIRIKILKDTGASQSIVLADVLPFSEKTFEY